MVRQGTASTAKVVSEASTLPRLHPHAPFGGQLAVFEADTARSLVTAMAAIIARVGGRRESWLLAGRVGGREGWRGGRG